MPSDPPIPPPEHLTPSMRAFTQLVNETGLLLGASGWRAAATYAGGPSVRVANYLYMLHERALAILSTINHNLAVSDFHVESQFSLDAFETDEDTFLSIYALSMTVSTEFAVREAWFEDPIWLEQGTPPDIAADDAWDGIRKRIPGWAQVPDAAACVATLTGRCKTGDAGLLKDGFPAEFLAKFQALHQRMATHEGEALMLVRCYLAAAVRYCDLLQSGADRPAAPALRGAARDLFLCAKTVILSSVWAEFES